jgi:glycosyltransferase 2 family protein
VTDGASEAAPPPVHPALVGVEVVEPPLPSRIRRPTDLIRFLASLLLLALLLTIGAIATQTTDSVDQELSGAVALLPGPLLFIVNLIVGFGFLGVPIAIGIDLILRRRGRQLLEALLAVATAILVVAGLDAFLINADDAARLLAALTQPGGATNPFSALVAGVVAYFVVARVGERRLWIVASWVVVTAFMVTSLLARQHTLLSLTSSLLIGLAVGQGMRYLVGTIASRPSGRRIAVALVRVGLPLAKLERVVPDKRDGRRYLATRTDGSLVDVTVLDRDQEGAGLGYRAWRLLRVRGPAAGRTYVSVRRSLEHEALLAYASAAAGARTPRLVATSEVGPYAALLAFEHVGGRPLSEVPPGEVTDEVLADAWEQLACLREARVAHRGFTGDNLLVSSDGRVHLLAVRSGEVAATDLALRIDVAQLLTALALVAGAERAVRTGALRLGTEPLAEALPVLQPLALSLTTRQEVRHDKGVLRALREQVLEVLPGGTEVPTQDVRLERLPLRTLFVIVGGSIAGYILLSQLSNVDLANLMATADWRWAGVALAFSVLTYVGAAFSLTGFVLKSVSWVRAFIAQVAASFVSLVAPPAVGGMALNARFLQKAGVDSGVAVATVGVWQAMAFIVHIVMLVLFGVIAGTRAETSFDPPQGAILGVVLLILVAAVVISLPWGRRVVVTRVTEMAGRVIPALVAVGQRPSKLAEGIGGNVLLNLAYCGALVASVRAFGGELAWPAIAVVYLAGSAIGSVAPTPGGLGAVEAALSAGLTAAGLDGTTAVSAVLLFRVVTYWLPVAPGWVAFQYLQRRDAI